MTIHELLNSGNIRAGTVLVCNDDVEFMVSDNMETLVDKYNCIKTIRLEWLKSDRWSIKERIFGFDEALRLMRGGKVVRALDSLAAGPGKYRISDNVLQYYHAYKGNECRDIYVATNMSYNELLQAKWTYRESDQNLIKDIQNGQ